MPDSDSRDAAVPLPGRWFVNEVPADVMSVVQKLTNAGRLVDAFGYLEAHLLPLAKHPGQEPSGWPVEQIAQRYWKLEFKPGRLVNRDNRTSPAAKYSGFAAAYARALHLPVYLNHRTNGRTR
ncbi:MAG: hypothetical protein R3C28_29750 [Pirellulaceae bacterium]